MGTMIMHTGVASSLLDQLDTLVSAGTGTPTLKLYSGLVGTTAPTTAPTGTLLQTINLSDPAFGAAAVTGTGASQVAKITLATDTPQTPAASGVCGCFGIFDGDGTLRIKGDAGATGSGAMLELSTTTVAGAGIDLTQSACIISLACNLTV